MPDLVARNLIGCRVTSKELGSVVAGGMIERPEIAQSRTRSKGLRQRLGGPQMSIEEWSSGVLAGIGAGDTAQNGALLSTWARFESGSNPMRWNNPINTTQKQPGSVDSGAQPGSYDVQKYTDAATGIRATVTTLTNGRYEQIVQGLRQSAPPSWYQANAAGEFATWGTGSEFLSSVPVLSGSGGASSGGSGGSPGGASGGGAGTRPSAAPATPTPTPAGSSFPGVDIAPGSSGSEVSTWQQRLNDLGYSLTVDGIFGEKTEAATRDYQSSQGLTVDGIVGRHTWDAAFG